MTEAKREDFDHLVEERNNDVVGTYTDADNVVVIQVSTEDVASAESAHGSFSGVRYEYHPGYSIPLPDLDAPTDRKRPFDAGYSTAVLGVTAGTVGAIVRNKATGKRAILSNNHVLANMQQAEIDAPVVQPGPYDGGRHPQDTVGHLSRYKALRRSSSGDQNTVDCAIADLIDESMATLHSRSGAYLYGRQQPWMHMRIEKDGRTTGRTYGKIHAIDATLQVSYGQWGVCTFRDCILSNIPGGGGDSGSGFRARGSNRFIGLLFAGGGGTTVGCKQYDIFKELDIELVEIDFQNDTALIADMSHWNTLFATADDPKDGYFKANRLDLNAQTFADLKAAGVAGVLLKITQADDIVDPKFYEYYDLAVSAGLWVGAYIFVTPSVSARAHFDNFVRAIGDRKLNIPVAMDVEVTDGQTPAVITAVVQQLGDMLKDWQYGKMPVIYTSPGFWNANVLPWSGWKEYLLWLALWTEDPNVFNPITDVASQYRIRDWPADGKHPALWQWVVFEDAAPYGVKGRLDLSVAFPSFFENLDNGGTPPPPERVNLSVNISGSGSVMPAGGLYNKGEVLNLTATPATGWNFVGWGGDLSGSDNHASLIMDSDKVVSATFAQDELAVFLINKGRTTVNLNYRTGPGTGYTRLGTMPSNKVVARLDQAEDSAGNDWICTGYLQWAAQMYRGQEYIHMIRKSESIPERPTEAPDYMSLPAYHPMPIGQKANWFGRLIERLFPGKGLG